MRRLGISCLLPILGMVFMTSLAAGYQSQQADGGTVAADKAYQELKVKDLSAAIEDFRKALAADPANLQWRKDLGYAYLSANRPAEAFAEFETVYREQKDDYPLTLELGYLAQRLGRDESALQYFGAAQKSSDSTISRQAA